MEPREAGQRKRRPLSEALVYECVLAGAVVLAGGALWLAGLAPDKAALVVVLPYLGRHLWLLGRLARLIRRHHRLVPPFPYGLWGDVYRTIGQYQQRGRKGRKRQVRFTRRFREAANSVPDALVVLDKNQHIDWANPAAAVLLDLHWPRDDGRRLTAIFAPPGLSAYLEAGDYRHPIETAPEHNRSLMLSVRVAPFGERKRQHLVVGRDITEVFHLNMIRRDFVANASHELRTPLTVITGFLENLANSPQTPDTHRRPLDLMQKQSGRMREIIEDLLTLSRLEMDEHAAPAAPVVVAAEIGLILSDAQALSAGEHVFETDIDLQLLLLGSEVELRSAFSNLVFNAVKHTPPGTQISVRWGQQGRHPVFVVSDNGPGIEARHVPRLTERFYRVDKARSRASGGTGLGLAIAKHVLNRHDAQLLIASAPGRGTTFTCRFPVGSALRQAVVT